MAINPMSNQSADTFSRKSTFLAPRGDKLIRFNISRNGLVAILFSLLVHAMILLLVPVSYTHLDVYKRQANERLIAEIEELEHKARRQDVLIDEHQLFAFYDSKIPADIFQAATFEKWREGAEKLNPKLLYMTRDDLMPVSYTHLDVYKRQS